MNRLRPPTVGALSAAVALAGLLCPVVGNAQSELPQEAPETPIPQLIYDSQVAAEGPPPGPVRPATPFAFGDMVLRPHVMYSYMDEQGLLYSPGNDRSSIVQNFAPGLLVNWGQDWSANYTPTWIHYSNPAFHGGIDQLADVEAAFNPANWLVQASETISVTSDPEIETGMQTTERNYNTSVTASKAFTNELAATASFAQSLSSATVLYPDSRQWSGSGGVRFQWLPPVTVSADFSAGFFEVVHSTAGYFLSPTLGVVIETWNRKLTLNASAGVKRQTFYQRGLTSSVDAPTVHMDAAFRPYAGTSIRLLADSSESFSQLLDDGTRRTDWGVAVSQELLAHFNLYVSGTRAEVSYQNFGYEPGLAAPSLERGDLVNTLSVSLGLVRILQRGNLKVIYEASRDSSSIASYNYSSREIGAQISYAY